MSVSFFYRNIIEKWTEVNVSVFGTVFELYVYIDKRQK